MTAPDARRSSRARLLRWGLPALAIAAVVALLLVFLLPDDEGDGAGPDAAGTSTSAPEDEDAATATPTPTAPPEPVTELPAPEVVAREGVAESERTITGATVAFPGPGTWADGSSVRVAEARQQVTSGTGPGELAGQPQTVFVLELTNGSAEPLDVNGVVVQATYGADRTQAGPLYDGETMDFGGTVAPGDTAVAIYSFAIPEDQLGDVVLSVDVDGYRFPVVLTGAVPTT